MEEFPTVRCIQCKTSRNLLQIPNLQEGHLTGYIFVCEDDLKVLKQGKQKRLSIKFIDVEEDTNDGEETRRSSTDDGTKRPKLKKLDLRKGSGEGRT